MKNLYNKHLLFWTDKTLWWRIITSLILLTISIFLSFWAQSYTNTYAIGSVTPDIILDNIPTFDVTFFFFQGAAIFMGILAMVLVYEPKYLPFTIEGTALFFVTRSFFMIMTHLASPGSATYQYVYNDHHIKEVRFTLQSGNDLFFSGHTGYPFFLALIFWNIPILRYFFFGCSMFGAVIVLLGHLHYSIDVFSAFFIAYGVFEIARRIFKKEFSLIK